MVNEIIQANNENPIPLFGLDFLGILDRGTNVLEIKPITICNLHCQYCFVSAGDYIRNFIAEPDYLLQWLKIAIDAKNCDDLEIHFAPYGEILLYKPLIQVIQELREFTKVKKITMQTNGLLLTKEKIHKLEQAGVDRLNISLNSMEEEECAYYCDVPRYNLDHLLKMFEAVLESQMELLIAPVWFKNINDQGIYDIITFIEQKQKEGYKWPKLRLGIQNYLSYKTGRKMKKTRMRDFGYFYHLLHELEQKHHIKLKLNPEDFGIHKTNSINTPVGLNDHVKITILMQGRWKNEYIGIINNFWGVKVICRVPLKPQQQIRGKIIKSTLSGNLLTAIPD